MTKSRNWTGLLGAALLLSGCSLASDSLWPTLAGEDPVSASPGQQIAIEPSLAERGATPPALGSTNFQVQPPTPGQPTGTFVGQKVQELREDLRRLQGSIAQHNDTLQQIRNVTVQNAAGYHGTVAAINARLQVGTTPGNPILVNQWDQAQRQLETLGTDIAKMNELANRVAADSNLSAYMLQSTRAAYGLSGAVEEDHRQLNILEDDVNRTVVLIDRLLNEMSDDVRRQTLYVSNERNNLQTLALAIKNGQLYGSSLANRAFMPATIAQGQSGGQSGFGPTPRPSAGPAMGARPLVVIRFDRPNVSYEEALYNAVSTALERRPDASFDLVAVSTNRGGAAQTSLNSTNARRNAERVLRTLTDMGLPAARVNLSAASSGDSAGNEVHLYVR
ncbi:MAG: hypothetical protein KJ904_09825 [Alphaproteobacteria bacterium]|nr:hypothetical protein [Alphaproteobacteria bacterium]MBU0798352.1 hypothetical protein [Alphaproteobacteria bacterium]MBU0887453.1 hypothetical protein [Alphaproteobacteria bacterium]MBU1813338.1 hypothetical protein [Alphaproteobacteria bacterium]MBU2088931.1 hypothetical protein [Alphaproteobacteria bacterium]